MTVVRWHVHYHVIRQFLLVVQLWHSYTAAHVVPSSVYKGHFKIRGFSLLLWIAIGSDIVARVMSIERRRICWVESELISIANG